VNYPVTHTSVLSLRFAVLTLAAVLGVAATVALGRWQLSRAAGKEALQAQMDVQQHLPPLDGTTLNSQAPLQRRVQLRGRWLAAHTIFLDNRSLHGQPGFEVLTPLQLDASATVVLVQRGWAARNFVDRLALPLVQTPGGLVMLQGRIVSGPSRVYEFAGAAAGPIRQNLDVVRFATETRLPLLPLVVQQTGAASEGLQRQWSEPATGIDKHYGYAFQWFGLAGLIAILYVWFQIVRRFFRPPPNAR